MDGQEETLITSYSHDHLNKKLSWFYFDLTFMLMKFGLSALSIFAYLFKN